MPHEPTLEDLLKDLWRARAFLLAGALTGLALAACFLIVAVPHYRATMLVAPAERGTGPDIKALLPGNSSFAVQYMMDAMGSADSRDFMRFEHTMRGPLAAQTLLEDKRITQGVKADRDFRFGAGPQPINSPEKLAAYLGEKIAIEPVGNTPLRRVVYKHPDREFAAYLLRRLHETADNLIRQEIRERTANRSVYLEQALLTTDHPDHRRALTSLLMEQEHVRMILAVDEPFAAIIAEPPYAEVKVYWPRAAVIVPAFMMVGTILGYGISTLRRSSKS